MIALLLTLFGSTASPPQPSFDQWFTGATLRFDYYHSGIATEEHISLDRYRREGPWSGTRASLLDPTNFGKYRFLIRDADSDTLLYCKGFASIYGEWETTGEAADGIWRTFHESQRFPEPKKPCRVFLEKRNDAGDFEEIYRGELDPASRFVDRSSLAPVGEVIDIEVNGDPQECVDLLILGEGYTAEQKQKFEADTKRLVGALLSTEPFQTYRKNFNVRAIHVPSPEPGISNPRQDAWVDAPLGLSFNAFDSDRYVLTENNRWLRDVAAQAPYDALYFLFNSRKYGGGGIFNLWATCAADTAPAEYVFVHEFGHSFAGLADEYYTSSVSYEDFVAPGSEPWEPNITALLDPDNLKWKHLATAGLPLPTPWNQEEYDRASLTYQDRRSALIADGAEESTMDGLFEEVKQTTAELFAKEEHYGKVGAFQGAGYQATGLYRPSVDCIMFTRNPKDFCAVCHEALERVIQLYLR